MRRSPNTAAPSSSTRTTPTPTTISATRSGIEPGQAGRGTFAEYRRGHPSSSPNFAGAHYNLGNALGNQDKPDEAIAEYRRAIELDPTFAAAHVSLGNVLGDQHKLDEAIAEYRRAIELRPELRPRPQQSRPSALAGENKLDEAIAEVAALSTSTRTTPTPTTASASCCALRISLTSSIADIPPRHPARSAPRQC